MSCCLHCTEVNQVFYIFYICTCKLSKYSINTRCISQNKLSLTSFSKPYGNLTGLFKYRSTARHFASKQLQAFYKLWQTDTHTILPVFALWVWLTSNITPLVFTPGRSYFVMTGTSKYKLQRYVTISLDLLKMLIFSMFLAASVVHNNMALLKKNATCTFMDCFKWRHNFRY